MFSVFAFLKCLFPFHRANAVSVMSVDLFHKLLFMPQNLKCLCLPLTQRKRESDRGKGGGERSGGARDGISLIQYLLIKQNYFL